jgi:RNA polymerase sigma-70 factor (ECF subfamily)
MGCQAAVIEARGRAPASQPYPPRADAAERRREDEALVARVRQGDLGAFETLYRKHSATIFGLTLRLLQNRADAEDLVQEIFLQAYDRLSSFEGRAAFGTWLYRLGVNRCLDHLRSRGVKEQLRSEPLTPALPGKGPSANLRGLELERAIAELPSQSRAAFLLHDVAGYDHREVGEILGIAVGTSKSLVHRARTRMRELVRPPSPGENS